MKKEEICDTFFRRNVVELSRNEDGGPGEALRVVGGPRPNPDCPRSARMASYMQAACSLAVKQNGANCDHLCNALRPSMFLCFHAVTSSLFLSASLFKPVRRQDDSFPD
ncbi:hypothetical protein ANTPLA_LOCUS9554 [Anthophora plagiata]